MHGANTFLLMPLGNEPAVEARPLTPKPPRRMAEQIARLQEALGPRQGESLA